MKRSCRLAFAGAAGSLALSVGPVVAQQAQVLQARPAQTNTAPQAADPSLSARVTIEANGQSVQEVLQSLNVFQGLRQGQNVSEPPELQAKTPVGWQHVTIYAHEQPVSKVMAGLQTLFNDVWVKNSRDPAHIRYILTATGRSQEYDREMYRLTLERGAEPMLRLTEYLKTPVEEHKRLNDKYWKDHIESKDPLLQQNIFALSSSGGRTGLEFLATLSPEQRFTLLSEGTCFVSMNAMTEPQRRLTHNMGLETGRIKAKWDKLAAGETQEDSAAIGDRFGVMLIARVHPTTGAFLGFRISTGQGGGGGGGAEDVPPPTPLLAARGNPYHYSPGSKTKPPVYPDLQQMPFPSGFKLEKGREYAWRDVLTELSKHVSLSIYSDDFSYASVPEDRLYGDVYTDTGTREHPLAKRPKLTNVKLSEGLDALCSQYGYLWWYQDGALFFRSRTWFLEQLYEAPPPIVAFVRRQIETEGKLNAEGLTALSGLTKKQLLGLSITNLTYGPVETGRRAEVGARLYDRSAREEQRVDTEMAWDSLQVFALLNEEQKRDALSPEGLRFEEMPPAAQQQMFHTLYPRQSIPLLNQPGNVHLQVLQRMTPPLRPDGPRQANIIFALSKSVGFGAAVVIRVTPAKPKTSDSLQNEASEDTRKQNRAK